jgi:hypothetical protein
MKGPCLGPRFDWKQKREWQEVGDLGCWVGSRRCDETRRVEIFRPVEGGYSYLVELFLRSIGVLCSWTYCAFALHFIFPSWMSRTRALRCTQPLVLDLYINCLL